MGGAPLDILAETTLTIEPLPNAQEAKASSFVALFPWEQEAAMECARRAGYMQRNSEPDISAYSPCDALGPGSGGLAALPSGRVAPHIQKVPPNWAAVFLPRKRKFERDYPRDKDMQSFVEIVRDLLIFVVAMFALLITLIVIVSKMPDDNPLKRILSALSYRVGATVAAGVLAIPIEPIPGLDAVYDIGVPIALIWYWFTFFRDAKRATANPRHSPPAPREINSVSPRR
jgi:hypothetical protein